MAIHVNTNTGDIGSCKAKRGRCPFGGDSGLDNHYATHEEAVVAAEQYMNQHYGDVVHKPFRRSDEGQNNVKTTTRAPSPAPIEPTPKEPSVKELVSSLESDAKIKARVERVIANEPYNEDQQFMQDALLNHQSGYDEDEDEFDSKEDYESYVNAKDNDYKVALSMALMSVYRHKSNSDQKRTIRDIRSYASLSWDDRGTKKGIALADSIVKGANKARD